MYGILPQSVRFPICCCMFQKQGAWARAAELGVSISGFSLDRARLPELGTEKKRTRLTIKRRQGDCWRPHSHRGSAKGCQIPEGGLTCRQPARTTTQRTTTQRATSRRKCSDSTDDTDDTDNTDHPATPTTANTATGRTHATRGTVSVSSQRYRCLLTAVPPSSRADSLVSSPRPKR